MLKNTVTNTEVLSVKSTKLNSLLIVLLLMFNYISSIIDSLIKPGIEIGILMAGVIFISYLITITINRDFLINLKSIFLLLYILIIMFLSFLYLSFYSGTADIIINFTFFGLLSYLIGSKIFDTELVLKYSIYISVLSMFVFSKLLDSHTNTLLYTRIDMGISYALLPGVFAAILHFIYYRSNTNWIIWVGYIFNTYCLYLLLFMGTRGSLLSIVIFIWFLLLNRFITDKNNLVRHVHKRGWVAVVVFLGGAIILLYEQIFFVINEFINIIGIKIAFIEKTNFLIQTGGDFTNSRISLYNQAIIGIKESPIWGQGVGAYQYITGFRYPHNIILELLFEGGLILALPIVWILSVGVVKIASGKIINKDIYVYAVLVICSSLPRLMISGSIWNVQILWLLMALLVNKVI